MAEPYYITTAIHYPNGKPHIGHAYETIAADVAARFQRLMGREVRFQTGTDEHGLKMAQKARDLGMTPRQLADEMSGHFRALFDRLDISYDRFFRTTEEAHHRASQAIWRAMEANGDLYLDRYEGWYSVRDEAYYDESELSGGEGGEKLSPQGTPVEWTVEESWFFRLSKYQEPLLALYRDNPEFVRPASRLNEVRSFVEGGLRDLSVSRTSFDWGVRVPGAEDHVMYVWVDALTNYLTGLGYPEETSDFSKFWPADVHLIGKDIVRFHAVYWPAFLLSAGLPLPRRLFVHGYLTVDGEKISKSGKNVEVPPIVAQVGVDALRWYFARRCRTSRDGDVSLDEIVAAHDGDLADGLGNLVQRCTTLAARLGHAVAPPAHATADAAELLARAAALPARVDAAVDAFLLDDAAAAIGEVVDHANRYLERAAPWRLARTDPAAAAAALHAPLEVARVAAAELAPFVPRVARTITERLRGPEPGSPPIPRLRRAPG
jgi:methionyl-tRNA synthetase